MAYVCIVQFLQIVNYFLLNYKVIHNDGVNLGETNVEKIADL